MITRILRTIHGCLSLLLYAVNTLVWAMIIFLATILRLIAPVPAFRKFFRRILNGLANCWVGVNSFNQRIFSNTRWDIKGIEKLDKNGWYMVVSNHQSWVDILVLQRIFHRKIPFLKFFLKKELFWFPILGQAWWALDFPFMKRYSKSFLKKNPHMLGKDLEITKKACEKFKSIPVSVMNFVEGTRFTTKKHRMQRSPYNNLLRSKAGGIAFVLTAMENQLQKVLDVTIAYPKDKKSFWNFLCGNISDIRVRVRVLPVDPELQGDYLNDRNFRKKFQAWLNGVWTEKDRCLERLMAHPAFPHNPGSERYPPSP